jgi:hypothetical protein
LSVEFRRRGVGDRLAQRILSGCSRLRLWAASLPASRAKLTARRFAARRRGQALKHTPPTGTSDVVYNACCAMLSTAAWEDTFSSLLFAAFRLQWRREDSFHGFLTIAEAYRPPASIPELSSFLRAKINGPHVDLYLPGNAEANQFGKKICWYAYSASAPVSRMRGTQTFPPGRPAIRPATAPSSRPDFSLERASPPS